MSSASDAGRSADAPMAVPYDGTSDSNGYPSRFHMAWICWKASISSICLMRLSCAPLRLDCSSHL